MLRLIPFLLAATLVASPAPLRSQTEGPPPPISDPPGRELSRLQDSLRLSRLTSGVMPPDGLLTLGLGTRTWNTVYLVDDEVGTEQLRNLDLRDFYFLLEVVPRSWLHLSAQVPYRTWSGGTGWIPASGSGLGDGTWQLSTGLTFLEEKLSGTLFGGGNIPVGDTDLGLGEGVFSPRAGGAATVRFWTRSQVPEMRLHFNLAHTWNRREALGYGMGTTLLEPWPPRYQSADAAGGSNRNDAWTWGLALEFRQGTASMWLEYARDTFRDNDTVTSGEELSTLGAGLRWGVVEKWALEGGYLVSLADDDESTPWWPAYPDWLMHLAVTRQFSIGGSDTDGDGIVDRHDRCPDDPEDLDGFQDTDGCPDLDNDQDGIPDRYDMEPDLREDYDGFEDADGAPDLDNDGDGVPDLEDLCPDEPEDFDGHHDDDGCPDELQDSDGDGIEDRMDDCPDDPEDMDGFEDDDGCPEPDNDLDGIPDELDECPDEAEDYDGTEDGDGCPEDD